MLPRRSSDLSGSMIGAHQDHRGAWGDGKRQDGGGRIARCTLEGCIRRQAGGEAAHDMLRKLTSAKPEGGECRLVAARHRRGWTNDKMQRDETVKVGDKLPNGYRWGFCNDSAITLTGKRAQKFLLE